MNGNEALERMCKFNCSATELGPCFRHCEEYEAIEKELKVNQILKNKIVDLESFETDMFIENTIKGLKDFYNREIIEERQLTQEEIQLIVDWIRSE